MRLTPSRLSWKRLALRSRLSKLTLTSLNRAGTKVPALSFLQNGCTASLFQHKARRVARKLIQSRGVHAKACLLREDLALRSRLSKLTLTSLNRAGTKVPALSFNRSHFCGSDGCTFGACDLTGEPVLIFALRAAASGGCAPKHACGRSLCPLRPPGGV